MDTSEVVATGTSSSQQRVELVESAGDRWWFALQLRGETWDPALFTRALRAIETKLRLHSKFRAFFHIHAI